MNRIRKKLNLDAIHRSGITGRGVNIAILDTGIYRHRDLSGNIVKFVDFVNMRSKPYDDNSHGTHVAGIISSSGAASDGLYRGVAPGAGIISLKVLDYKGGGDSATMIKALEWIKSNREKYSIRIVNISVGTESSSCQSEYSRLIDVVEDLWDDGLTVITSAGNNGPAYHTITIPGTSRKVITIGTDDVMTHTDSKGIRHHTYSSKGPTMCDVPKPDIIAPGSNIISCYNGYGNYISKSGTSMSTPIVSGAAALVLSYNKALSNDDFKKLLCKSADDAGLDYYTQGCGRLNISKMLLLC